MRIDRNTVGRVRAVVEKAGVEKWMVFGLADDRRGTRYIKVVGWGREDWRGAKGAGAALSYLAGVAAFRGVDLSGFDDVYGEIKRRGSYSESAYEDGRDDAEVYRAPIDTSGRRLVRLDFIGDGGESCDNEDDAVQVNVRQRDSVDWMFRLVRPSVGHEWTVMDMHGYTAGLDGKKVPRVADALDSSWFVVK